MDISVSSNWIFAILDLLDLPYKGDSNSNNIIFVGLIFGTLLHFKKLLNVSCMFSMVTFDLVIRFL